MPELPEVESAMDLLRARARGRTIRRVRLLHPALKRRVSPARLRTLAGARVAEVERRGKHQLMHLGDGRVLHVHFRMNGDWAEGAAGSELPRFARAVIEFADDTHLVLVDSRALGTLELHPAGLLLDLGLGPDAADERWSAAELGTALAKRKGPIKPALLDQAMVAGLGNIYAAESLWRARIDPRVSCRTLSDAQVSGLRDAIRYVIARATGSRYTDDDTVALDVYDREGEPCRRCGALVERIVQAGRSTFFCPECQRASTRSTVTKQKRVGTKATVANKKSSAKKATVAKKKSSVKRATVAKKRSASRQPRGVHP